MGVSVRQIFKTRPHPLGHPGRDTGQAASLLGENPCEKKVLHMNNAMQVFKQSPLTLKP